MKHGFSGQCVPTSYIDVTLKGLKAFLLTAHKSRLISHAMYFVINKCCVLWPGVLQLHGRNVTILIKNKERKL